MKWGTTILAGTAGALVLAGCANQAELTIRAKPTGLAQGEQPVNFRVAEARGHFALGNVGLALEGFRKALREEPANVDAMNGIAACYDRMGRFDLSRRYYEQALAVAPGDARLYANLAVSLELQGRRHEAASVRSELAARLNAGHAATIELASVPAEPPAEPEQVAEAPSFASEPVVGPSSELALTRAPIATVPIAVEVEATQLAAAPPKPVAAAPQPASEAAPMAMPAPVVSVALAPPRPVAKVAAAPVAAKPAPASEVAVAIVPEPSMAAPDGPRLERLSMREVALVTAGPVRWKPRFAERPQSSALATSRVAARPAVLRLTLLNAARSQGLAARSRSLLQQRGWSRVAIGNAPRVQRASVIYYPRGRRAEALRLAHQFGFTLRSLPGADNRLIVYLGRDAASAMVRRRA